jgi:hypothetical protein
MRARSALERALTLAFWDALERGPLPPMAALGPRSRASQKARVRARSRADRARISASARERSCCMEGVPIPGTIRDGGRDGASADPDSRLCRSVPRGLQGRSRPHLGLGPRALVLVEGHRARSASLSRTTRSRIVPIPGTIRDGGRDGASADPDSRLCRSVPRGKGRSRPHLGLGPRALVLVEGHRARSASLSRTTSRSDLPPARALAGRGRDAGAIGPGAGPDPGLLGRPGAPQRGAGPCREAIWR